MPINGRFCVNSKANIGDIQPNSGWIMAQTHTLHARTYNIIWFTIHNREWMQHVNCAFCAYFNVSTAFAMKKIYLSISEFVRATIFSFAIYLSIVCWMFSMKEHTQTIFLFDSSNWTKFFFGSHKKTMILIEQIFSQQRFIATESKME